MAARQGYRGYVSPRSFGGYVIPIPLQSLALRDYCARKGKLYVLPANENIFAHSYLVLEGLVRDLADYEGVVMCSMHMLPQREARRRTLYRQVLDQSCSLHFVIEDAAIASVGDADRVEEVLRFAHLASQAPSPASLGL
jgi:sporadic carbohydrate cluster protein (TIGR04323 family)